jgi:tetratricopeptide (TPR) repeat protein
VFTPQRLDRALSQQPEGAPRASFLDRDHGELSEADELRRRTELGAYLVARLVDHLLRVDGSMEAERALRWQRDSTLHYVRDLPQSDSEPSYLAAIAAAVQPEPGRGLFAVRLALHDYASFLEHEARLEEALDTLRLSASTWLGNIPAEDFASLALFAGRLNRQLGRCDLAAECYAGAEEAAVESGDAAPALRARLGRAGVHSDRGLLHDARHEVERVISDAEGHVHLGAVAGLAWADLGAVLARSGRPIEAVRAMYNAFRRTLDPIQRLRILAELGAALAELGANDAARLAFALVADSPIGVLVRAGACIRLMDLASSEGDRLGFERHRAEVRLIAPRLPPRLAVDFDFRTALGFARFGQFARADELWREALELATAHRYTEWTETIEQVRRGLDGCRAAGVSRAERAPLPPEVEALAADLRVLAARAGL